MKQQSLGVAVVTGASSGIGAVYADRLARRGYDLILVARSQERLSDVAMKLAGETGRMVQTLPADLTDAEDLAKLEKLLREDSRVTLLVNNAGFGSSARLVDADIDEMSQMISLNVNALTRLTYAVTAAFIRRGTGTIINIASVVAVAPEILNGVYGASKAYVLAFSQSLRHELANSGVNVQVVLPGATGTNFFHVAGMSLDSLPQNIVMSTEHMVDAALMGLDQGEFVTIPPLPDVAQWRSYEAARQAMRPNLSRSNPAERYSMPQAV